MNRDKILNRIGSRTKPYDIAIVGGGATGVGAAVDAASRGYDVVLFEQNDFGKGTSSRSTKLVHGGVRYLEQGNISLVMEALKERGILRANAPHLVHDLAFVVPTYDWWEGPFYGIGLKIYDVLAGKYGFGRSRILSREATIERIPTIATNGLRGGVVYFDGQFDDARLLIHLVTTAVENGADLVNYAPVTGFSRDSSGFLDGLSATDLESGRELVVEAKVVINAAGPFGDQVRTLEDPGAIPRLSPSQGVHVVLDKSFLPGDSAIMVPHLSDGRVLFALPFYNAVLVGTTDTPLEEVSLEPRPRDEEVDFILNTAGLYLHKPPSKSDVLSVFAGIRPLVKTGGGRGVTAALSRDHSIDIGARGLLTIAGGKWTTYRKMAEDVIDCAATLGELTPRECRTKGIKVHGYFEGARESLGDLAHYGADAAEIEGLAASIPGSSARLHPRHSLSKAQIIWAARREMARTVEDVLARRSRVLLLDARAALELARTVAQVLAPELARGSDWVERQVEEFSELARQYSNWCR